MERLNGRRAALRRWWARARFGVAMALGGVGSHRLRSVLTILGVTIGVASVTSLVAIGEGARLAITRQFESLGTNVIKVESHDPWRARLTVRDAYELEARVPTIAAAMPVVRVDAKVKWRRTVQDRPVLGVTEAFPFIRDHPLAAGRFFAYLHVTERVRVAVVGANVARDLFGGREPVGQRFYLNGQRFTVIGVLAPKGKGMADDIDDKILVPVTTAQRLTWDTRVGELWLKARSKAAVDAAVVQVSRIFRKKFNIQDAAPGDPGPGEPAPSGPGMGRFPMEKQVMMAREGREVIVYPGETPPEAGFRSAVLSVTPLNDLIREADAANRTMTYMLGGVAGVSLLVGGLGIMNIMLVAVSERTREIGLRKALGARRSDLLFQFVTEAFLLTFAGGVAGVGLGAIGAQLLQRWKVETLVTSDAAWAALGSALVVGLLFGVYPASVAAGLEPVDALRREN